MATAPRLAEGVAEAEAVVVIDEAEGAEDLTDEVGSKVVVKDEDDDISCDLESGDEEAVPSDDDVVVENSVEDPSVVSSCVVVAAKLVGVTALEVPEVIREDVASLPDCTICLTHAAALSAKTSR